MSAAPAFKGSISFDNSLTVPAGNVISQNPSGGAEIAEGSSVDLVISSGPPPPITVNGTIDAVDVNPGDGFCDDGTGFCSLRAAIMEANALPGPDTLEIPEGTFVLGITGTGEDAAATGDLDITDDLTIIGAGMDLTIIDGGGNDRVFHIVGAITVDIDGMKIQNGVAVGAAGGGVLNEGSLTLSN